MKTITLKSGKEIELNQAFNMDCLEFMKELPDKCIDLVLTDPPYGINHSKSAGEQSGQQYGNAAAKKGIYKTKDWDKNIPHEEIFKEIFRISKNQIIWGGNYFSHYLKGSSGWIFWDKNNGSNNFSDGELAYTSFTTGLRMYKYTWNGMLQEKMHKKEVRIHPTQKPLDVIKWCLKKHSKENDLIFDPFLGSFTTAIASSDFNLNWIGTELDPDYFKSGYHRYEQETKQMLMEF